MAAGSDGPAAQNPAARVRPLRASPPCDRQQGSWYDAGMKILSLVAVEPKPQPLSDILRRLLGDALHNEFRPFIERLWELVVLLERDGSTVELFAAFSESMRHPEFTLFGSGSGASITVWCDSYAEAEGKPRELPYRITIRRGSKFTRDLRTTEVSTAAKTIRATFGLKGEAG